MMVILSYLLGISWYIFVKVEDDHHNEDELWFYHVYFEGKNFSNIKTTLTVTYFMLSTLSTVGLGDFLPQNSVERIIIVFIMLLGCLFFSFIMN